MWFRSLSSSRCQTVASIKRAPPEVCSLSFDPNSTVVFSDVCCATLDGPAEWSSGCLVDWHQQGGGSVTWNNEEWDGRLLQGAWKCHSDLCQNAFHIPCHSIERKGTVPSALKAFSCSALYLLSINGLQFNGWQSCEGDKISEEGLYGNMYFEY